MRFPGDWRLGVSNGPDKRLGFNRARVQTKNEVPSASAARTAVEGSLPSFLPQSPRRPEARLAPGRLPSRKMEYQPNPRLWNSALAMLPQQITPDLQSHTHELPKRRLTCERVVLVGRYG